MTVAVESRDIAVNAGSSPRMYAEERVEWLRGRAVTVVGMRLSGVAAAGLLHEAAATVFVTDSGPASEYESERRELDRLGVAYELGEHTARALESAELLVVSPGVPLSTPVVAEARRRRIPVEGELETAYRFCRSRIIADTGANGKTTTTEWMGAIYRGAGSAVEVGGNVGRPFSSFVAGMSSSATAVLEVSSFQLETIKAFRPDVGVLLNITADHLDRHGDMETYRRAKFRLLENQGPDDSAVLNADDALVADYDCPGHGRCVWFSAERAVDCGVWSDGVAIRRRFDGVTESVARVDELPIPGLHNVANACAAIAAVSAAGLSIDEIRPGLLGFAGVPHRLEFVAEIGGARYVNDSKATNPDAVAKALVSYDRLLVVIMGGLDKGTDFRPLREAIAERVRTLVLTGDAMDKLRREIGDVVPTVCEPEFTAAVGAARNAAQSGDVVLLSPGCASFDQFQSYEERGATFRRLVKEFAP